MRTVNVPNLSAAFTGTFLTIAGMNSIAAAQEALFDTAHYFIIHNNANFMYKAARSDHWQAS